jgi:hypothetical protein
MYSHPMQGEANDRYDPLPGLAELPAFLWRKLPAAGKVAVVAAALGVVALAIALSPAIQRSKEEHAHADAARSARIERAQLAHLRREQRPRFGHGAPAGTDLAARGRLVASATGSIQADASTRAAAGEFNGPIMRVQCRPYPPVTGAVPADEIASRSAGRYACLAVTSEIPATPGNPSGVLGHPYRARIDFRSGRYAFCKVSGRPGELAIKARPAVPVPKVCGG